MALIIALMALTALELSSDPFHEPFHGNLNLLRLWRRPAWANQVDLVELRP
jgi:hypothetical protein